MAQLMPFLDAHWQEEVVVRGIDGFDLASYPPGAPATCRPDWRDSGTSPETPLERFLHQAIEPWNTEFAICSCLHGGMAAFSEDLSLALVRAVNDWVATAWLGGDSRLRGSILLPVRSPEACVDEIDRVAADPRFVQILLPVSSVMPWGRRQYWPIYQAAERHGLTVALHAGSVYHHPLTASGWPSYYVEDYVSQSGAFQNTLASLVSEGVFAKFPSLKVVLLESGFTWLPNFLWRADKTWMALRNEIPWVALAPSEYIRNHVFLTLQPVDAPLSTGVLPALLAQDEFERMLLFSTDYPHWHFEGADAVPSDIPPAIRSRMMRQNAAIAYPRLALT